jgi:hypothetical protein
MAKFIAPNSTIVPNIGSAIYGELYEQTDASARIEAITTGDTFQGWKFATAGPLSGLTADASDATADHLTVPVGGAGDYLINTAVTWSPNTALQQVLRSQVYINGSPIAKTIGTLRVGGTPNFYTTTSSNLITLADSDEVSLYYTSDTNSDSIQFVTIFLTAVRVS